MECNDSTSLKTVQMVSKCIIETSQISVSRCTAINAFVRSSHLARFQRINLILLILYDTQVLNIPLMNATHQQKDLMLEFLFAATKTGPK